MASCAQKQTWLADAEAQYHALQTGTRAEAIGAGDKTLRNTASSPSELLKYIQSLRAQVAACTGVPDTGLRAVLRMVPK